MPKGSDLDYLSKLFVTLGENGRHIYLINQIPVDMVYPLLFGIIYPLLLAYFLKKNKQTKTSFLLSMCIINNRRNCGLSRKHRIYDNAKKNYPDFLATTVNIHSLFSVIKSISNSLFFITLRDILLLFGFKLFKKARSTY